MNNITYIIFACLIAIIPSIEAANPNKSSPLPKATANQDFLKTKMCSDLDIIKNCFEVKYAPYEWKKTFADWELQEQIDLAKSQILSSNNITINKYQQIVKRFFNSTRDYHVGVFFHSTAMAVIPIRIERAENRYFVTCVSSEISTPISIGDEVLYLNGRPIEDVVAEIKENDLGNPDSLTDQKFAEIFLTVRLGALGHTIPTGNVQFVVQHKGKDSPDTYDLPWVTLPEKISSGPYESSALRSMALSASPLKQPLKKSKSYSLKNDPYFQKEMTAAIYKPLRAAFDTKAKLSHSKAHNEEQDDDEDECMFLGSKKGVLPNLGTVIWEADKTCPYRAYLYQTPNNKKIGYIRISDYMNDGEAAREFAKIIDRFNQESDALVLDQLSNPGGIIFHMYGLASMLSPYPLTLYKESITITQGDVHSAVNALEMFANSDPATDPEEFLKDGDDIFGYQVTPEFIEGIKDHFQFIISEWNAGHNLTQPTHFFGIERIQPSTWGQYKKPILMLVNSLDLSCADFLPALLQDNRRATIMGTRTAGAGGVLLAQEYPSRFGIAMFSYTGSIVKRPDNNPIENLGVTPDVFYEVSANDLQNNYADYIKAINATVESMTNRKTKARKP